MFERLNQIEAKYDELTRALASPEIIGDSSKYQKTAKAHSELAEMVEKYREFKDLQRGIQESKAILADESDTELREYAQEELTRLEERRGQNQKHPKVLLIPQKPQHKKKKKLGKHARTPGGEATPFSRA